jgi:hypothetical protein
MKLNLEQEEGLMCRVLQMVSVADLWLSFTEMV